MIDWLCKTKQFAHLRRARRADAGRASTRPCGFGSLLSCSQRAARHKSHTSASSAAAATAATPKNSAAARRQPVFSPFTILPLRYRISSYPLTLLQLFSAILQKIAKKNAKRRFYLEKRQKKCEWKHGYLRRTQGGMRARRRGNWEISSFSFRAMFNAGLYGAEIPPNLPRRRLSRLALRVSVGLAETLRSGASVRLRRTRPCAYGSC